MVAIDAPATGATYRATRSANKDLSVPRCVVTYSSENAPENSPEAPGHGFGVHPGVLPVHPIPPRVSFEMTLGGIVLVALVGALLDDHNRCSFI